MPNQIVLNSGQEFEYWTPEPSFKIQRNNKYITDWKPPAYEYLFWYNFSVHSMHMKVDFQQQRYSIRALSKCRCHIFCLSKRVGRSCCCTYMISNRAEPLFNTCATRACWKAFWVDNLWKAQNFTDSSSPGATARQFWMAVEWFRHFMQGLSGTEDVFLSCHEKLNTKTS